MNFSKLAARALTLFPAIVIAVAAMFEAHGLATRIRARPLPDAVTVPRDLAARWLLETPMHARHRAPNGQKRSRG